MLICPEQEPPDLALQLSEFSVLSVSPKCTQSFHNPTKVIWSTEQACNWLILWLDMHTSLNTIKNELCSWPLDRFPLNKSPRHMWEGLVLRPCWPATNCYGILSSVVLPWLWAAGCLWPGKSDLVPGGVPWFENSQVRGISPLSMDMLWLGNP